MDQLTLNGDVYFIEHGDISREIHSIASYVSLPGRAKTTKSQVI